MGHNDLFVVPNFLWRRHINTGKTDAVIYSVSDAALMQNRAGATVIAIRRPKMQSERGMPALSFSTTPVPC
jgi:gentisate 1,2-dioxygenase